MQKYINNVQIKKMIDKILIDTDCKKSDIAKKLNISRQQITNTLNKKQLSFYDIATILDCIDYDLYIDMRPRNND